MIIIRLVLANCNLSMHPYIVFHIGAIPRSYYYHTSSISAGPVLLDYVRCIGNESCLLNCTHNDITIISSYRTDCLSSVNYYAAGVQCLGKVLLL